MAKKAGSKVVADAALPEVQLDATELRKLAERADGLRNRNLKLVVRNGRLALIEGNRAARTEQGAPTLRTNDRILPSRRPRFTVQLIITGRKVTIPLRNKFDAFFWSESAIEKFVVPYYSRIWPAAQVQALFEGFANDPFAIGVRHPPESDASVFNAGPPLEIIRFDTTLPRPLQIFTVPQYLTFLAAL